MNKKAIEKIATMALAAALVGMFFYQAAHATNESCSSVVQVQLIQGMKHQE
jgi:hypothetical protein